MTTLFSDPVAVAAVLCLNIAVAEWLVRHTLLRHFGTALLVILLTAVAANLGLIPASSNPLFDGIFRYVAPLAIFFPLLQVNLRGIIRAGGPMLVAFGTAAIGTFVAVPLALWLVGAREVLAEQYAPLGGMFVGTYTGGSVNFNAIALHYGIAAEGTLFAGAVAVDNIVTAVWMIATLAIPRFMASRFSGVEPQDPGPDEPQAPNLDLDRASLTPSHIGLLLGLGLVAVWMSERVSENLSIGGWTVPSVILLTTIALALAQFRAVAHLKASRPLGMFAVYLFLAVIGAFCDLSALGRIGSLGVTLLLFAGLVVMFHGLVTFVLGRILVKDWGILAVASQANIGGAASALALARSLERQDLLLPAILVGSLGYGAGTYLGFVMAEYVLA